MKNRWKTFIICGAVILAAVITAAAGVWVYADSLAYKIYRAEAGVLVTASDFLKNADEDAFFTENSEDFDVTVPGEYTVKVKSGMFVHTCTLIIQDTVAPSGETVDIVLTYGETCEPEDFVTNIEDVTDVTASFYTDPDFTITGSQTVKIVLEDEGENKTILETELSIIPIETEVTVEAGSEPPSLDDFVLGGNESEFLSDVESLDLTELGDHKILLKVDGIIYTSVLHVTDTTPPEAQVHDIEGYTLVERSAEDFVTSVDDVTDVTVSFLEEPCVTLIGEQTVTIVFEDEGGNVTELEALLILEADTEPPVISGTKNLTVYVGDSVSYKSGVTVTDNCDEDVTLSVNSSNVDLNTAGTYTVTYTATDLAGNTSTATITVTVVTRTYSLESANALVDQIFASILSGGMTDRQKAQAIFTYIQGHVSYISYSEKGNYVKAAYIALTTGKGDCYSYASVSQLMLDRAGIQNVMIAKIPSSTSHYWNLVYVDGGWYHFDTTPRVNLKSGMFLWTEAQLVAYSDANNGSHNYDRSAYPTAS